MIKSWNNQGNQKRINNTIAFCLEIDGHVKATKVVSAVLHTNTLSCHMQTLRGLCTYIDRTVSHHTKSGLYLVLATMYFVTSEQINVVKVL